MTESGLAEFIPQAQVTTPRVLAALTKLLHPSSFGSMNSYAAAAKCQQALVAALAKHNTRQAADIMLFFAGYGWDHLPGSTS